MKIAIDIDGVLADVVTHILPYLNEKYSKNYQKSDITHWDFPINGDSIGKYLRSYFSDPSFMLTVPEELGAKSALDKIWRTHEIIIATGRPNFCQRSTYLWLDGYRCSGIKFTSEKTVKNLGCDLLIDDYSKYLDKFSDSGGKTICFRQPWNKDCDSSKWDYVANGWEEVLEKIEGLEDKGF